MKSTPRALLVLTPTLLLTACGAGQVSYSNDVQPILDRYCENCHSATGEGAQRSKYFVTSYDEVMQGTKFGEVVVPGSRLSSSLYLVVAGKTAPEIRMPPHNEESLAAGRGVMLSADAIETIGLWIDQGAKNN
jgi:hypothetical protein